MSQKGAAHLVEANRNLLLRMIDGICQSNDRFDESRVFCAIDGNLDSDVATEIKKRPDALIFC